MDLDLRALAERGERFIRQLTARSSSNFKFAFLFLSEGQREGLTQVYQFCRTVDDIVDERPPGDPGRMEAEAQLGLWSDEIARIYEGPKDGSGAPQTELGRTLGETVANFDLPREAFDEIIAGCAMDLDVTTYPDLSALELYCYRVASCVGILCMGIFGDQSEVAQRYAKHLGLALQYTNILRDIGEDAARGRVYLPIDLLERHGLSETDALRGTYDERFLAMAEEFADLAEAEYRRAWAELPNITELRPLLPAEVMGRTYYELLCELRARRFDVFTHRATLRRRDKLRVAAISLALTSLPADLPGVRAVWARLL